jgi:hypothetical protein
MRASYLRRSLAQDAVVAATEILVFFFSRQLIKKVFKMAATQ